MVTQWFYPGDEEFLASGFPQPDKVNGTNSPIPVLKYDAAATESAFFRFAAIGYTSGNLTVDLLWHSQGATSGVVRWEVALAAVTPETDTGSIETKAFATATTVDDTHLGTTAARSMKATVTITGASLDSIADGDTCWLRVARVGGNAADTIAGDVLLDEVRVTYT